MVDNDVSVLLTSNRISLLLSFIAHPEAHVTDDHFFAGIEEDLMVFQTDAISRSGLPSNRKMAISYHEPAL